MKLMSSTSQMRMSPVRADAELRNDLVEAYLALLKNSLTRNFDVAHYDVVPPNSRTLLKRLRYATYSGVQRCLEPLKLALVQTNRPTGETMMGMGALNNLHDCLNAIQVTGVPGDLVEAGVWRGGGTIFMKGFTYAHGDKDRRVWVMDSFEGLPKPKPGTDADKGDRLWSSEYLAVSEEEVRNNFIKYGLLDTNVIFLKGFFEHTIPSCTIESIALLRLDADMYDATMLLLEHLYPKLSCGGYVIIDDYGIIPATAKAVEEYRRINLTREELRIIGYVEGRPHGAYWRKQA